MVSRLIVMSLGLLVSFCGSVNAVGIPNAVEAAAQSPSIIRIYWQPVVGATGYALYRSGSRIATVGQHIVQYDDLNLTSNSTYLYQVSALNSSSEGALSKPYAERTFPVLMEENSCEVLVVGATTAGVAAAVTAARYGMKVALIEETRRLGGMPANGLGATDLRRLVHSSGFFEEFRVKVAAQYGSGDGLTYEPRVAQQVIKELLWNEPTLTVHREVRPIAVEQVAGRIVLVRAESALTGRKLNFRPAVVIDATECGDVAAWAGAPFRVGREARSVREPHAGHLFYDRATDKPLKGSTGKGDKRVQAYAYLMTVRNFGPGADKTITKPEGYDAKKYEHATPWDTSWAVSSGTLPHGKFEINMHPQGSDLQGINYNYPTANYAERRRIEKIYRLHALGYLYYIQTVEGKKHIGLSDDDYRDNDGWPALLYIREARRFEADEILDESDIDLSRNAHRANAIGIGDYPMDSHAVQPKTDWTTGDLGEGEFYLPQYTPWHQVPYQIMIPRHLTNCFVPTAVSATHVAYGTVRLEPVRMQFGAAAGIAAYFCSKHSLTPNQVSVKSIQRELLKRSGPDSGKFAIEGDGAPGASRFPAKLYVFSDLKVSERHWSEIEFLGARGFFPCPPPPKRTAAACMVSEEFRPTEPVVRSELRALIRRLADYGSTAGHVGLQIRAEGLLRSLPVTGVATRFEIAEIVTSLMEWKPNPGLSHFEDVSHSDKAFQAAEALYAHHIDPRNWELTESRAPSGKLLFEPSKPLTRSQFAQILYFCTHYFSSD